MTDTTTWTRRRLSPLRDLHAADLLERTARYIDRGGEVTPEPLARRPGGLLCRTPLLHLPYRRDLSVRAADGGEASPRVNTPLDPTADPRPDQISTGGLLVSAAPFQWQAAELRLTGDHQEFVWAPLRLWALEWLQPRVADEAPDLLGVIHSLSDPEPMRGGVRMRVDFGSAPPDCVPEMIEALALVGAEAAALGPAPEAIH